MTRPCIYVELPDSPDIREIWAANGNRYINRCAQEGARLHYTIGPCTVGLPESTAQARAEEMDIIRQQPVTYAFDIDMLKMIRGLCVGWEQSVLLFQYGVMVGKRLAREGRKVR